MHYPPFSSLANVLVRSDKLDLALQWTGKLDAGSKDQKRRGARPRPSVAPSCV